LEKLKEAEDASEKTLQGLREDPGGGKAEKDLP
jgi:hypothetical protein